MKKLQSIAVMLFAVSTLVVSCSKNDDNGYHTDPPPTDPPAQIKSTVVSAAGDLTDAITQFRSMLGDNIGNTSARREINWEGVPPDITNTNIFPSDFFNVTDPAAGPVRKRGLVYANTDNDFRVDSSSFLQIDASYANEFKAFSGKKLFANINNNITDAFFKVPGTNTDASVKGFGLVFSDVDDASSTTLEFFNGTKSLGVFKAPVRKDANGFSFLGVQFADEKITRVKITAGNARLAAGTKDISAGGTKDLVVMDDFFYSEPQPLN